MIAVRDLMTIHLEALFTSDTTGRLRFVNEPWATETDRVLAPRFFLGRTEAGHIWRFRSDLPAGLVAQLSALCREEPVTATLPAQPRHVEAYRRLLSAHVPIQGIGSGPAYRLPSSARPPRPLVRITAANAELLQAGFADLIPEVATAQPFFGIVQEGQAVSICRSVRITPRSHEAGVETWPACRGSGYAPDVVAAWAAAVSALGCLPLYSTAWENAASQRVAEKLGAFQYGVDFHIT